MSMEVKVKLDSLFWRDRQERKGAAGREIADMPDQKLCLEALSALSGCKVEATNVPSQLTPQDFVNIVALRQFYKQEGLKQLEYPSLGSLSVHDQDDLYSAPSAITAGSATAEAQPTATVKINLGDFFHPEFDYDFTKIKDTTTFMRGNESYVRPCGWMRSALRVLNKYDDGDAWLGTGASSWPVAYHGHGMDGSHGIILAHGGNADELPGFAEAAAASLVAAEPETKGRGVYSTPDVAIAERFCKQFRSKTDGKTYKVMLQSRINPSKRVSCQRKGYWLVYVPEGSNDAQTRGIVQEAMRPYGLLLKQV